jgi:hypothetical protein
VQESKIPNSVDVHWRCVMSNGMLVPRQDGVADMPVEDSKVTLMMPYGS